MNDIELSDSNLLEIDVFAGDKDDAGVRLSSSRMVTTRKPHICQFSEDYHDIPIGTRARKESAIMDNHWVGFYACRACLEGWVREEGLFLDG